MKKRLLKIIVSILLLNYAIVSTTSFAIDSLNTVNNNTINDNTVNQVIESNIVNEENSNQNIVVNENTISNIENIQNVVEENKNTIENNSITTEKVEVTSNKVKAVTKKVELVNNVWRMVINGKVDYSYTGIGENENGTWYVENGEVRFNFTGSYTDENGTTYIIEKSKVRTDLTKVMLVDDVWRMVINGIVKYNYNAIGSNENGRWYLQNGEVTFKYTGTYIEAGTAFIIEDSKVMAIVPEHTTEVILINNKWRMVKDGYVDYDYTGMGTNANGTWYVENGEVRFNFTGSYTDEKRNTYIIENSKVRADLTKVMLVDDVWRMVIKGVVKYNYNAIGSNENGRWYLQNGEVTFKYTGTYIEAGTAFIIEDSKVMAIVPEHTTSVVLVDKTWRMVKDGYVDYDYTGIGTNANGTWYVQKGEVTFKYTGNYTDEKGTTYIIKESKVRTDLTKVMLVDNVWRMVIKGVVKYNYNAIGSNENGKWYVQNGEVTFKYTGTYIEAKTAFIIENSKVMAIVPEHTTSVVLVGNTWRMVKDSWVDYNYNGIGANANGIWVLKNGAVDFNFTKDWYQDPEGSIFNVKKGEVREVIKNVRHPGTMCVDAPAKGSKHGDDKVTVCGWALSQETGDIIQIYLDNKFMGNAKRTDRPDVFKVYPNEYGGAAMTPKPGFEYKLNLSGLSRGTHTIKIVNLSNDKKSIISSREIPITIIKLAKGWGIDVSKYQGNIDWNAVRNHGVEFAILRVGYYLSSSNTFVKDEWFDSYYNSCQSLGIAVGGYVYSYAYNGTEGRIEAERCIDAIRGKTFELPIFLDVEDDRLKPIDRNQLTNASIEFCETIQRNGYRAGVYASRNFFYEHLDVQRLEKYNIWLAHYTTSTDYNGKYDFWQYTSSGRVPGISGNVDLDWCFTRYF